MKEQRTIGKLNTFGKVSLCFMLLQVISVLFIFVGCYLVDFSGT